MTDHRTAGTDSRAEAVAAALARLGQATAAEVAAASGVAYSTTTRHLRALHDAGQATPHTGADHRTRWRPATPTAAPTPASEDPQPAPTDPGRDPHPLAPPPPDPAPAVPAPPGPPTSHTPADTPAPAPHTPAGRHDGPDDAPQPGMAPTHPAPATTTGDSPPDGEDPPGQDPAPDSPSKALPGPTPRPAAHPDPARPGDRTTGQPGPRRSRRAGGTLRGAVLDLLEAHPDRQFKVAELCRLIDAANTGTDTARASQGAVANALDTLSRQGTVHRTADRPATFQLAPATTAG